MVTLKKREYEIKSANNEKSCFVYDSQYKTINNALQKIRDEIPEAISCVLYGSCSRNESKYESDVDLTADQQEVPDLYIGGGMNCEKDPQMFNRNFTLKNTKNNKLLTDFVVYGIIQS